MVLISNGVLTIVSSICLLVFRPHQDYYSLTHNGMFVIATWTIFGLLFNFGISNITEEQPKADNNFSLDDFITPDLNQEDRVVVSQLINKIELSLSKLLT